MFTLRYLLLCCAMATVLAQDDAEDISPVIWVLLALLSFFVICMAIAMCFMGLHFHRRFKKIESRFSRSLSGRDSRRSSKRSNGYENNPIRRKHSRSPKTSSPPNSLPRQQNGTSDHVVVPIDTIHRNLQDPNQHVDIAYTSNMVHYETLAANSFVVTMSEEEEAQYQQQQQQQHQEAKPPIIVADNSHNHNTDDMNEDVPMIEPSYTTPIERTRTVTKKVSDGNGNVLEYSDVVSTTPPVKSKSEHVKMNGIRKGKKPDSSEEYSDPMENGMANMKRLKATKSQDSPPVTTSKPRRASEPGTHRKDFEQWPIRSTTAHESDL